MVNGEKSFIGVLVGVLFLTLFVLVPLAIIDDTYKIPQAAEKANQICQEQGYDFYESFERIGILSNEPVAIECKYVQNYQEMDIDLRQTYGGWLPEVGGK